MHTCVRKQDGGDYEPVSLRSMISLVDRYDLTFSFLKFTEIFLSNLDLFLKVCVVYYLIFQTKTTSLTVKLEKRVCSENFLKLLSQPWLKGTF